MGILADIGRESVRRIEVFGDFCRFCGRTIGWLPSGARWKNLRHMGPRLFDVGAASVPVVMVTGIFVGAVLAVQAEAQFRSMGAASRLGTVVIMSVLRELGPILAGVMALDSADEAERLRKTYTDHSIPDAVIERLKKAGDEGAQKKEGLKICLETIGKLKALKGLRGIHVHSGRDGIPPPEIIAAALS